MTTCRAPACRAMATAMTPMGPAPVMSTSSPTTLKASAVCVALPSGSRIEAISSSIAVGSLNTLEARIVRYSGDAIAGTKAAHLAADFDYFSRVFMSDRHRHGHRFLRPRIPIVNMHIGAADGGTLDLDEHIVVADRGFRNVLHPDAGFRAGFDECFHDMFSIE